MLMWSSMRHVHILVVLITFGTLSFGGESWEVKQPAGNSFSPPRFVISLKSYSEAFSASAFCVDEEGNMPIGYVRELCDECERCSWKKRSGFTSETEWEAAVTTEMSRLGGNLANKEATGVTQIVGTWVAEAPLSLRLTDATIVELNSKLGVSLEDAPVVPETQDRVYYLVSGTPSEVQGLLAAGFTTVTPIPPRLKVDPVLEAAAAAEVISGRDHLMSSNGGEVVPELGGGDIGRHLHIQTTPPPGGGILTSSFSLNGSSASPGFLPPPGSATHLLSSAWTSMITSRVDHDNAKVMAVGEQHVTVEGLQSSAEWYQVALEIAHHGAVKWVAPQNRIMPSNYFARQLVESGSWHVPEAWGGGDVPAEYNPLSAMGLSGKGQVVGIADTGLDWNSCFFKDDKVTGPSFELSEEERRRTREHGKVEVWSSSKHRKIRQYVAFMNGKEDENDGHGTHISGSVAGSCLEQDLINRDYSGVAPDAKIAFFDTYSKEEKTHMIPSRLDFVFSHARNAGAHVYVASFNEDPHHLWGANGGKYSSVAKSLDNYCHAHQSFIVLTSAGNISPRSRKKKGYTSSSTISTPAEAKNTVTVGSHFNPDQEYGAAPADVGNVLSVAHHSARGPTHDGRIKPDVCGPGAGVYSAAATVTPLKRKNRPSRDLLGDSYTASTTLPLPNVAPPLVTTSGGTTSMATTGTEDATALKSRWGRKKKNPPTAPVPGTATPAVLPGAAAMTDDAPAENCRGVVKHGTSSSNAIVAGVTVLVRQYFTEGYYPDGVKKKRGGYKPMGALLKAVLVNSGRALTVTGRDHFNSDTEGRQPDLPSHIMGWGGVNIASTLVTPSSPRGLQLKVYGKYGKDCLINCPFVSQGDMGVYRIKTTPETYGLPLKVTLVWYDKASESMSRKTLVNDLDLTVMEHGVTQRDDIHYFANGKSEYDHTNTVEHIQVSAPKPNTDYTIKVIGSAIVGYEEVQNYALVISGPFGAKATKKRWMPVGRGFYGNRHSSFPAATVVIPDEPMPSGKMAPP